MAKQSTHQTRPNPEKNPKRRPTASGEKDAAVNRNAGHNYFLLEKFEAGVVLTGTEVKSVRGGKAKLEMALARGKQQWDKRETERRRTADREAREAIARARKTG